MIHDDDDIDGVEALNYLKKIEYEKKLNINQPMRSIDRVISERMSERMKTPVASEWEGGDGTVKIKSLFKNLSKPQN